VLFTGILNLIINILRRRERVTPEN
jgi:hypothetical protein